jgi:nucleotide-binding universal stress UspA family protein
MLGDIILVPTDFSDYSRSALVYSLALAKSLELDVLVYHSFDVGIAPGTNPNSYQKLEYQEEARAEKRLTNFVADFKEEEKEINIRILTTSGDAKEEIPEIAERYKSALVVMGTQGAAGLKEVFLGSVTVSVAQNVSCPVLAIPVGLVYKDFDDIVYATNFDQNDFQIIDTLLKLGEYFDSKLTCLHIYNQMEDALLSNKKMESLEKKYEDLPLKTISFKSQFHKNTYEGLENYLDKHSVDMLVMLMQQHSFFEKLFKKSLSKKVALNIEITPLLILKKTT